MGMEDRDWYREKAPPGRMALPTSMTVILIIVNVAMFVIQSLAGTGPRGGEREIVRALGLWPREVVEHFAVWQLVTSMFLHGGVWHILLNMFVLWMFGRFVEVELGRGRFLRFYFEAGLVAGVVYVVIGILTGRPNPAVGASGAIMGVLAYFTARNPNAQVFLLGVVPMSMKWAMALIVGLDLSMFVFAHGSTGIAHTAHLGGVAFGFLYYRITTRPGKGGKVVKAKPRDLVLLQDEVDRLLAKVSEGGLDSLSERERRFLMEASEELRRRRGR